MGFEPKHRNSVKKPDDAAANLPPDEPEKPAKPEKKQRLKKTALTKPAEKKEFKLPADGFINKYNFLRVSDAVLGKLGWPSKVKVNVTLDVQNGALIVKRKSVQPSFFIQVFTHA